MCLFFFSPKHNGTVLSIWVAEVFILRHLNTRMTPPHSKQLVRRTVFQTCTSWGWSTLKQFRLAKLNISKIFFLRQSNSSVKPPVFYLIHSWNARIVTTTNAGRNSPNPQVYCPYRSFFIIIYLFIFNFPLGRLGRTSGLQNWTFCWRWAVSWAPFCRELK